jgi:hypothetical protein
MTLMQMSLVLLFASVGIPAWIRLISKLRGRARLEDGSDGDRAG